MPGETDKDDWKDVDPPEKIPVPQLPWYETLRQVLEPYTPANNDADADKHFTSAEIISSIEQHHGVPQGAVGKSVSLWVLPDDFVRAMRYLGYHEENAGGVQLHWMMKKKKT